MTLQNRVTPFGEIVADPARGTLMGNRGGRIHDPATRELGNRRWASRAWIACVLEFKERHRPVMGEGYTELFFLDEVTALAAGHRPCYECRRQDAKAFAVAWAAAHGLPSPPRAGVMDVVLHAERRADRETAASDLPDGAMVTDSSTPFAMRSGRLMPWNPDGYGEPVPATQSMELLTPPAIVKVLASGYRPRWHPSAGWPVAA